MPEYHDNLIYNHAKMTFTTTSNKLAHHLLDYFGSHEFKITKTYRPNDPAEYWRVSIQSNFGTLMELYTELQTNYSREYMKVQLQTY